jgi:hypothetical protein
MPWFWGEIFDLLDFRDFYTETRTKRKATQRDCLPRFLGDGNTYCKVKKCAVRKKYFVLGLLEQLRQDKNLLNRHDSPMNQPRRYPFHLWTIIPHLTQFQQSAVSVSTQ